MTDTEKLAEADQPLKKIIYGVVVTEGIYRYFQEHPEEWERLTESNVP